MRKIDIDMKKALAAVGTTLGYLTLRATAFAQGELDLCTDPNLANRPPGCGLGNSDFGAILGPLITFVFVIAVILALGFLIYGGIRWITSGGDKAGVETARNTIIAAIIGLLIVVLSYFIINSLVLPFLGIGHLSDLTLPSLPKNQ